MRKRLPLALMALTLLLGTVGYAMAGYPPYEALIASFPLLGARAAAQPSNAVIEVARWIGIAFAFNVIYVIVETAVAVTAEDLKTRIRARRPDAIAVHGDGLLADRFAENIAGRAVRSDRPASFKAARQVLLFSDDEKAMGFYNEHSEELQHAKEVYIALDRITPMVARRDGVFAFSLAAVCAQLYWADNPVDRAEDIAIIGDGSYAEALLNEGLLVNIFSVEGGVRYRVYGDWEDYRCLHRSLDEALGLNADELEFRGRAWQRDLTDLAAMDRVILCAEPERNIEVASTLRSAGVNTPIHMRSDSDDCVGFLGMPLITTFGTTDVLCSSAIVLQQEQQVAGKVCAAAYRLGTAGCNGCERQAGFPEGAIGAAGDAAADAAIKEGRLAAVDFRRCLACPGFLADWRGMDEFTKSSNYAAAAHDAHKAKLLAPYLDGAVTPENVSACIGNLPQPAIDELQEVEHIRWCRFHYLNNWTYGPDGKDADSRTHHYLVPYEQLPDPVKALDFDAYRSLAYRLNSRP